MEIYRFFSHFSRRRIEIHLWIECGLWNVFVCKWLRLPNGMLFKIHQVKIASMEWFIVRI